MSRSKTQANILNNGLTQLCNKQSLEKTNVWHRFVASTSASLSPIGPGSCDHNRLERCANCITSGPYLACGIHSITHRKSRAGRLWGASLIGVSAASCLFHASSGNIRPACRRLDFWTIAASSNLMIRSIYPGCPPVITALGMAATPFKPFLVSFINSAAMEIKYIQRARRNPSLRASHRMHTTTCLIGLGAFTLEELFPKIPLAHAAWHCLSTAAVASINNLAADVEENARLQTNRGGTGVLKLQAH